MLLLVLQTSKQRYCVSVYTREIKQWFLLTCLWFLTLCPVQSKIRVKRNIHWEFQRKVEVRIPASCKSEKDLSSEINAVDEKKNWRIQANKKTWHRDIWPHGLWMSSFSETDCRFPQRHSSPTCVSSTHNPTHNPTASSFSFVLRSQRKLDCVWGISLRGDLSGELP